MINNLHSKSSGDDQEFYVVLFQSVTHAMKSEKILKEKGIPFKLIPVPKSISSDCGVCIRFTSGYREVIERELQGAADNFSIVRLPGF